MQLQILQMFSPQNTKFDHFSLQLKIKRIFISGNSNGKLHLEIKITFIAASVWIYSISLFGSPISPPARCTVLTIPAVIVLLSWRGLPIATTHSPGLIVDDEPRVRVGNLRF